MKNANDIIAAPLKHFRARVATGIDRVDRTGGRYGFGVVRGVSIITRGAALGHTLILPTEDQHLHGRRELQDRMAVLLGQACELAAGCPYSEAY